MSKRQMLTQLKDNLVKYIETEIYSGEELNTLRNMTVDNFAILLKLKILPLEQHQRIQIIESNIPSEICITAKHRETVSHYMNALIDVVKA
jgi:hypothetical protein